MPERLVEVTVRDRDTEEVIELRTYGGLGFLPIGADLMLDDSTHLYMPGSDAHPVTGSPIHPLTVSLTTSAGEHLAYLYIGKDLRKRRWVKRRSRRLRACVGRERRWRLIDPLRM